MQTLRLKKRLIIFAALLALASAAIGAELNLRFPKNMFIYQGENLNLSENLPYTLSVPADVGGVLEENGIITKDQTGFSAHLKLFGVIPVKTVNINVLDTKKLTIGGNAVGIKLFTKGLLCVGVSDIEDIGGNASNAANLYDIRPGDIILSANGIELEKTEDLGEIISSSSGEVELTFEHSGAKVTKKVKPIETPEGKKLGIWVRDSTAGIGTLTFLDPETLSFGALGHPISDSDTGVLMPISRGEITEATIDGITKGISGSPGELRGVFKKPQDSVGKLTKNCESGIFGNVSSECKFLSSPSLEVGSKNIVREGPAKIVSNIEGGICQTFDIEIERVMRYNIDNFKDLVIRVTDSTLLEKTGGIVQGMSGSPIIQDGKLVGAVTHVFVNDPTRGYGIFIENMLAEAEKIK